MTWQGKNVTAVGFIWGLRRSEHRAQHPQPHRGVSSIADLGMIFQAIRWELSLQAGGGICPLRGLLQPLGVEKPEDLGVLTGKKKWHK